MSEAHARPASVVHFPGPQGAVPSTGAAVTPFSPAVRQQVLPDDQLTVRLAIYESEAAPPAVYDVAAADPGSLLAELGARTLWWLSRRGSPLPGEAVLAVVENLIHAHFRAAAVSVLTDGSLQVSDQGPGIADKERAMLPGFTTATPEMRRYIRGVGSGLPVARRLMENSGGRLLLQDNLGGGTVVGLWTPQALRAEAWGKLVRAVPAPGIPRSPSALGAAPPPAAQGALFGHPVEGPALSRRQILILRFLEQAGPAGPSQVARHLSLSLTTAFRELSALEALGLAASESAGKRRLTGAGEALLRSYREKESPLDPGSLQGRRP